MEIPLMLRFRGTVILTIWWQILLIIVYTSVLLCVHNVFTNLHMDFPLTLIPVLGVVTGLLLVFRTNTAYDRYYEGRQIWSKMTWNIRTITRCIWVGVLEKEGTSQEVVEKVSAINLLAAFAYATKNYLRKEYSYEERKLRGLIDHLPRFSSERDISESLEEEKFINRDEYKAYDSTTPTNIPIELTYHMSAYIRTLREKELTDDITLCVMTGAVNSLVDCLGGLERILRTPIPLAYSVHLHHATWIFLLTLPYQLIGALNWFTIPAVAFAAFALLGILGIGWEIENPFGYDANDLPLDDFCEVIHKEILRMTGSKLPPADTWLYTPETHPLIPGTDLKASDLLKMEEPDVRRILAQRAQLHDPEGVKEEIEENLEEKCKNARYFPMLDASHISKGDDSVDDLSMFCNA